jgi:hypothetical protein
MSIVSSHAPDVMAGSWLRRLWLYIWVVPRAQWDLFDVDYQIYVFRLFHREQRTIVIHYITILAIMLFSLAFLSQWPLFDGAPRFVNMGAGYALAVALLHLPWCLSRGLYGLWLGTAATLTALSLGGTIYLERMAIAGGSWWEPTALWANPLLWVYVFALAETVSHALEPVPPYTTGAGRWMSNEEFRRQGGKSALFAAIATPTIFTLVSFLSNPRSIPMVVLRLSARAGYQRALVDEMDAVARDEWRSGQPHMHSVPKR